MAKWNLDKLETPKLQAHSLIWFSHGLAFGLGAALGFAVVVTLL
jgi:hypothetical protein